MFSQSFICEYKQLCVSNMFNYKIYEREFTNFYFFNYKIYEGEFTNFYSNVSVLITSNIM